MSHSSKRRAFTLVELLVTVAILGIISGMLSIAVGGARRQAQETRGRALIDRLNLLMLEIYEKESERRVDLPADSLSQAHRNFSQLLWKRDWLRAALPDRISDVDTVNHPTRAIQFLTSSAVTPINPGLRDLKSSQFQNRVIRTQIALGRVNPSASVAAQWAAIVTDDPTTTSGPPDPLWSVTHQSAECLYLILATQTINGTPALQSLTPRDIADTDGDGMPEIVDPWKNPVGFMRWPVGYSLTPRWNDPPTCPGSHPSQPEQWDELAEIKRRLGREPLDLLYSDPRYSSSATRNHEADDPFPVVPMIISAGSDKVFDIQGLELGEESTHVYQDMYLQTAPSGGYVANFYAVDPFLIQTNGDYTLIEDQYGARVDTLLHAGTNNTSDNIVPALTFER